MRTTTQNNTATSIAKPWLIDLVLLGALWGASFLFMRIGAAEFGALPTAAVRVSIAALFLLPIALVRGQGPAIATHWKATFGVGVFNSGMPFALFCFALLTINSGLAAVINATVPMFGALVAWAWFRERPSGSRIVGLVIGFTGVAMLASRSAGLHAGASSNAALWAVIACLGACLCYGISASATRRYLGGVPPLATATGSQLGATLFLALPAIWLWPAQMPSLRAWLALLALGIACTGVAYILFFRLIERAGPARALTVTFLVPVFALFYGAVFLGESITQWMLISAVVIVCGVALSTGVVRLGPKPKTA
ncbi:drug/metabolite transporter (DMT)-like permease [Variovorax sp. W1I1]|uniref:DMT family transporter n=1 Tax=Variovorax sp. W1I1 TaxID=3042309 RepID=UPI002788BEED|nr:DMT family transporter [Variovorax sp. W1I1]MDQ0607000.1 drug/metabolite transporter (DMT)-like permease [Variovorax sp. W1I1]